MPAKPKLLSGGNPQIPKGYGDAPVQAYIKAMPGWKRELGRRLDALIIPRCHQPLDRLEPRVRAALRVGTFQLLHDVPAHAAVNATVSVYGSVSRTV